MLEVEQIASMQLAPLEMTDEAHLSACMARMDANLKRKAGDAGSAALRLDTEQKILGRLPKAQLSYATKLALVTKTFVPTIAELLELAKDWQRQDARARDMARAKLDSERTLRTHEARKRLKFEHVPQDEIDRWPDYIREQLASERRPLLIEENGQYRQDLAEFEAFKKFLAGQEAACDT